LRVGSPVQTVAAQKLKSIYSIVRPDINEKSWSIQEKRTDSTTCVRNRCSESYVQIIYILRLCWYCMLDTCSLPLQKHANKKEEETQNGRRMERIQINTVFS